MSEIMPAIKYDARKLSNEEQALLRRIAVQRVVDGESAAHVGRSYGLGNRTICRIENDYAQGDGA